MGRSHRTVYSLDRFKLRVEIIKNWFTSSLVDEQNKQGKYVVEGKATKPLNEGYMNQGMRNFDK